MKLIVIYGPPAVGKLTVAKALSEITGYKLFHNHLSRDLVRSLFSLDHPRFHMLVEKVRLEFIEEAMKEKLEGVIFTLVYDPNFDNDFLGKINDLGTKYNSEVTYVQLKTDTDTLLKRVAEESRQAHSKVSSPEKLRSSLAQHTWFESVPFENNLTIDNTDVAPSDVAQQILTFIDK
jgi:deoxyadenosine/deoxycytidine kinase